MKLAAPVLLVALVLAGCGGSGSSSTASTTAATTAAKKKTSVLDGVPQSGTELGRASAQALVVEFADMQCPYCGDWARQTLPHVVRTYVTTGRVRLVWRGIAFLGPDSEKALRAVDAAALQNKLWNMVEGLYERQGGENSGWVTDTLIRQVAGSIPGLNVAKLMKDRDSKQVDRLIATAKTDAQASGVQGTPAFFAGKPPGALHQLQLQSLDPASFDAALNAALAQ